MTKRIFRSIFLASVCVFFASAVLFMAVLYEYFLGVQRRQLRMQTDLAAQGIADEGMRYLEGLEAEDCRVTWIDTDGGVIYDSASDADQMENHLEREEIREALAAGYGESTRYSATLTKRYLYSAKRLRDGTVLRLSIAQSSLLTLTLGMLQPICMIFVLAVILSLALASRISKRIVRPLNDLNLDEPFENDRYDELAPLFRRIDIQQRQIQRQSDALRQKQSEFETVTRGMTEGIVLLNKKKTILSMNRAAAGLLGAKRAPVGQDILSVNRSPQLIGLLERAGSGQYAESVLEFGEGKYQIGASPVVSDGEVSGIVLLLLDVTEKEKNEQLRREFTANVSHELKTPLHTISGSAELLANGMVKEEDVARFSKQIYTETQRMIRLVEDIIGLSRLDEGADGLKREELDLGVLARETVGTLSSEARAAGVSIGLDTEAAFVYGIRRLLDGIVYNLCDNAVRYNRRGGSVWVSVKNEENAAVLSVADTGIGIPKEHQERIFERFYRVDQSHSKEIGGTGLGLSIVKHAARLHNAEIGLDSVVNVGTTVTVRFPKEARESGAESALR